MAKENEKKEEEIVIEAPVETPYETAWMAGMEEAYPDLKGDREALFKASKEGYDKQRSFVKKAQAEAQVLDEILSSDPELNEMFTDIFKSGKDGHPILAALRHLKPLAQKYINGEITDEEFLAEKKRLEEQDAVAQKKREMQEAAFVKECEERGWDVEETLIKLDGILNGSCENEDQCREQVRQMFKIIDFDDAVSAAEVRGKNATIKEEKRKNKTTDVGNTGAAAPATQKKSLMASSADQAQKMKEIYS
jgi:hypothetical protein